MIAGDVAAPISFVGMHIKDRKWIIKLGYKRICIHCRHGAEAKPKVQHIEE